MEYHQGYCRSFRLSPGDSEYPKGDCPLSQTLLEIPNTKPPANRVRKNSHKHVSAARPGDWPRDRDQSTVNKRQLTGLVRAFDPSMSHPVHHIPRVSSTEGIEKSVESHGFQPCRYVLFSNSGRLKGLNKTQPHLQLIQHRTPIDILDDDALLNMFCLYRPALLDGDEGHSARALWGLNWNRERWWYKLAHVCRRWRHLIFGSASSSNFAFFAHPECQWQTCWPTLLHFRSS